MMTRKFQHNTKCDGNNIFYVSYIFFIISYNTRTEIFIQNNDYPPVPIIILNTSYCCIVGTTHI